ncbi:dTDP-4-dehydrorhamnose 3,5-epimerase family protein [Undibacterium sp. Dicai25W]|uniref:dTDP-4-dehydrorhamnose 3,5-epimerase family protein n=1 Tax=Undibacterium sp. Dicai25W TaxID=3413034 RepID=UPI003BF159BE
MSERFLQSSTPLSGLTLLKRLPLGDARGFFERMFCDEELSAAGWRGAVRQINHTYTQKRGTVRGLHFQLPPHSEMKLVSCLRGEIWDVVVDVRKGSPTFLHWHAERLSAENHCSLLIPQGFAHGFQTLTDEVDLLYCHSEVYSSGSETGLSVTDPRLNIVWPLPVQELSGRDQSHPLLTDDFKGVQL